MRLLALVAACMLASTAAANPVKRKAAPDKFARAASEAFVEAVAADQKGDLRSALGLYTKAFQISIHPSTAYNIADVQLRLGMLKEAVKSYETYLALAPNAPDRADVQKMIDKLLTGSTVLSVTTAHASSPEAISFKWAYVLIDGVIVKKPGTGPTATEDPKLNFDVTPGKHVIDVITDVSFGTRDCEIKPGEPETCLVNAPPRTDGTIIVSGDDSFDIRLEPKSKTNRQPQDHMGKRFVLPAGKRRLYVEDRWFECPPIVVDVPSGNDVAYLYITTSEPDSWKRCRTIDVRRQRLTF